MNISRVAPRPNKGVQLTTLSVSIKSINEDERVVFGEVYPPYIMDSHGELMLPEDVRLLAYRFLANKLTDSFDVQHNNQLVSCNAVESFIARPNDPDGYTPGSWVLGTQVLETDDTGLWDDIKSGKINGYSIEMMVRKVPVMVEYTVQRDTFGFTEENDGHNHVFYAKIGDDGRVAGGSTSEEVDNEGVLHSHLITYGTATEDTGGHSHRFFLP